MKQSLESGNTDELEELFLPVAPSPEMEPCSSSELASRVKDVCEMVCELEDEHTRGCLKKAINRVGMKSLIGVHLFERYQRLSLRPGPSAMEFRSYWVNFAVESFLASLRHPNRNYMTVSEDAVLNRPSKLEVFHDGLTLTIEQRQISSCRSWGIWFDFKNPKLQFNGFYRPW